MSEGRVVPEEESDTKWSELIGSFFTSQSLAKSLGITESELQSRTDAKKYLATITSDGFTVYPAFQFDGELNPLPHLDDLYEILDVFLPDGWSKAFWLNLPKEALGKRSPAEVLRGADWLSVFRMANHELHISEN